MNRPESSEYATFYANYIAQVESDDIVMALNQVYEKTHDLLSNIPESKGEYAYAEGKWTIKEVIRHILDAEWVFAYRAMRISKNDQTALPGFDQDEYAKRYDLATTSISSLLAEFDTLRKATIMLFTNFKEHELLNQGTASGYPVSVRALGFITAGHNLHHIKVLEERYL